MDLKKKGALGLKWQLLSIIGQAVISLVYFMYLARVLSKEDFGVAAIVMAFISILQIFTDFGFGAAIIQQEKNDKAHISFAFYSTLGVSVFLYLLLWGFSGVIVDFYDNSFPEIVLLVVGLNLIFRAVGVISKALIIRNLELKSMTIANVVSLFVGNIVVGLLLAYNGYGYWSIIFAFLVQSFLFAAILFYYAPHSIKFHYSRSSAKDILMYGSGLVLVRFLNGFTNQADKFIGGKMLGMTAIGLYERIQYVAFLPKQYIGTAVDSLLFSMMSRLQTEEEKLRTFFSNSIVTLVILFTYIAITIGIFADSFILLLLGDKWLDGVPILQLFSLLIFFQAFARFSDTLVRATNTMIASSKVKLVFCIAMIVFVYLGAKYGISGLVIGVAIANLIHSVLMFNLSLSIIKLKWLSFLKKLLPVIKIGLLFFVKSILLKLLLGEVLSPFFLLAITGITDVLVALLIIFVIPGALGKELFVFIFSIVEDMGLMKPTFLDKIKSRLKYLA